MSKYLSDKFVFGNIDRALALVLTCDGVAAAIARQARCPSFYSRTDRARLYSAAARRAGEILSFDDCAEFCSRLIDFDDDREGPGSGSARAVTEAAYEGICSKDLGARPETASAYNAFAEEIYKIASEDRDPGEFLTRVDPSLFAEQSKYARKLTAFASLKNPGFESVL